MWSARVKYYEGGSGATKGTWPAWWVLGNWINEDPVTGNTTGSGSCWPMSGAREMDIWEWVTNNNGATYINNGITGNGCQAPYHQSVNTSPWNAGDWITTSVKVDGGRVKFYRGGVKTHDISDAGLVNEDFAAIFNLAVSGMLGGDNWDFNGTDDWASLEVDWVAHEVW
jgi:hypothetical protein